MTSDTRERGLELEVIDGLLDARAVYLDGLLVVGRAQDEQETAARIAAATAAVQCRAPSRLRANSTSAKKFPSPA